MHRRLLLAVLALVLAAVAWWAMSPETPREEGLVVRVQVLDPRGAPIHPAQLERIYDETRVDLDKRGSARLTHVLLRAGDEPSPEAFTLALRPVARYAALPPGRLCAVRARKDGSYDVAFALRPCGLLRLHVRPTHLGPCAAVIESVGEGGSWARVGSHEVARAGSVIDYRVFDGTEEVIVRIDGEPNADGAIAVATRRYAVPAPSPGHVVQHTIEPEPVAPIVGRILRGDGPEPPSRAGVVRIREILADGHYVDFGDTPIEADGSFVVRTSGAARYKLTARVWCHAEPLVETCTGGDLVEWKPTDPPQWVRVSHAGFDPTSRPMTLELRTDTEERGRALPLVLRQTADATWLALPMRARWLLGATVAGSHDAPPLRAALVAVDGTVSGEIPADLELGVEPHGTLVVKTTPDSWAGVRSARIVVDGRGATLVGGAAEAREIRHVRAGRQKVRIEWDDDASTVSRGSVDVPADGRAEITLARNAVR